jgi:ubiquinone/menaquinone biosynthesis C-methylase UbiE
MNTNKKRLDESERLTIQYYRENAEWCAKVDVPTPWIKQEWARTFMPSEPRLLDIGCGHGRYMPVFQRLGISETQYVGIDPAVEMLEIARRNYPGFDFREMDLYSLPDHFTPGHFNIFVAMITLSHVTPMKIAKALSAIRQVMSDDGVGLVTMRESNQTLRYVNGIIQDHTFRGPAATFAGFTFDRFVPKLRSNGFSVRQHVPSADGIYTVLVDCI